MSFKKSSLAFFDYSIIVFACLVFVALSHYFFWQIGDDSYIYFRYVERALQGKSWTWADYSGAVEGYSSPLWYVLLVMLGKLGVGVEIAARSLGLLFSALTVLLCWQLARHFKLNTIYAGLACLLLVSNEGFHYWATSGLETAMYMAAFAWAAYSIITKKHWLIAVSVLAVIRPEGPFLLIGLVVALFVFRRDYLTITRLVLLLLPFLAWLALRFVIYQDVLPNTFYAKATGNPLQQLINGFIYSLLYFVPLSVCWALWFFHKTDALRADALVLLGMISMLLGIVLLGGGDWMFYWRLLLPTLALLAVLIFYYLQQSTALIKTVVLLGGFFLLPMSVSPMQMADAFLTKQLAEQNYQEGEMTRASLQLAEQIKQQYPQGGLVAVNHAGALPYALANFDVIDMVGLNDKTIAKAQGGLHQKFDMDYVLSLRPDLIVLNSRVQPGTDGIWYHKGYWAGEDALVEHAQFKAHYQPTSLFAAWQWQIPFPYNVLYQKTQLTSWIMVYQRIN